MKCFALAGCVALAGCARSPEDVKHRFEARIHEESPSWGDVKWKASLDTKYPQFLTATVPYHGEAGVHVFEIFNDGDTNNYDVGVDRVYSEKKSGWAQTLWLTYSGANAPEIQESNCSSTEQQILVAMAGKLRDAFYYARH